MATITESLVTEHAVLGRVFDRIDGLLPEVQTLAEARFLYRILEVLLADHGDAERDLAYAALDHVLAERGELDRLHQEHEELDLRMRQAGVATDRAEACRLLKEGLGAARDHFRWEETVVFPLIERVLSRPALEVFAEATRPAPRSEPAPDLPSTFPATARARAGESGGHAHARLGFHRRRWEWGLERPRLFHP